MAGSMIVCLLFGPVCPSVVAQVRAGAGAELAGGGAPEARGEVAVAGVTVTPHVQSTEMKYSREPDRSLGARVQVFLQNRGPRPVLFRPDTPIRLRGRTADEWLASDHWAWHDLPSAWTNRVLELPPGAMTVWSWNGKRADWGIGTAAELEIGPEGSIARQSVRMAAPSAWLSAVTFLGPTNAVHPDAMIVHVANQTTGDLRLEACRLWLPADQANWRVLRPREWITNLETFPTAGRIAAGDRGGARVRTGPLPLSYGAVEVRLRDAGNEATTLWAHLRIKPERFDISGGWVAEGGRNLTNELFLRTLRRMHINTAHIGDVPGYTDNPDLYDRYPLRLFNKLGDLSRFDRDEMLSRIHAVEFLGEPQYGGGRPVPPMEVWRALAPYQATRLPTTVTHSEERLWRFYAGLSDYAHYDAYRVTAPSPDAWGRYDRWGGPTLRWGAPLETIGEMSRSLRELNRPAPVAYWSQGAHSGWGRRGGRMRASPTADELRAQAYHALSSRITSLYWFNLSLASLLKFPDLIGPMTEVGREMALLDSLHLEGDATHYRRVLKDGKPDWDLAVVAGPGGAVLFALDLAYQPDLEEKVFRFAPPRAATFEFPLPGYLREPGAVVRVSAGEVTPIPFERMAGGVRIAQSCANVGIYVVTPDGGGGARLEERRRALVEFERSFGFDPAGNPDDLARLRASAGPTK